MYINCQTLLEKEWIYFWRTDFIEMRFGLRGGENFEKIDFIDFDFIIIAGGCWGTDETERFEEQI